MRHRRRADRGGRIPRPSRGPAAPRSVLRRLSRLQHGHHRARGAAAPNAFGTIYDHYAARLSVDPDSIPALTGASFARWVNFDYPQAIQVLNQLLDVAPDDLFGTLFRGSSRLLHGKTTAKGVAELEPGNRARSGQPRRPVHRCGRVHLRPARSRSCRGRSEPRPRLGPRHCPRPRHPCRLAQRVRRAVAGRRAHRASLRPRHDRAHQHSAPGGRRSGDARSRPGAVVRHPDRGKCRADDLDLDVQPRLWDSIAVLFAPDGAPVVGSDDDNVYLAEFDWEAVATGTYVLYVTSFESVSTGELVVERS